MSLLSIRNLHASIGDKEILKGIDLDMDAVQSRIMQADEEEIETEVTEIDNPFGDE